MRGAKMINDGSRSACSTVTIVGGGKKLDCVQDESKIEVSKEELEKQISIYKNITYKGVVFNEMKGVFSSPESILDRHLAHSLFPSTTYGFESGGDPEAITDLVKLLNNPANYIYYNDIIILIYFFYIYIINGRKKNNYRCF